MGGVRLVGYCTNGGGGRTNSSGEEDDKEMNETRVEDSMLSNSSHGRTKKTLKKKSTEPNGCPITHIKAFAPNAIPTTTPPNTEPQNAIS